MNQMLSVSPKPAGISIMGILLTGFLGLAFVSMDAVGGTVSTWYTCDTHVHNAFTGPPPSLLLDKMKNANIQVANVLVWGGCSGSTCDRVNSAQYLRGQEDDPDRNEGILERVEIPGRHLRPLQECFS